VAGGPVRQAQAKPFARRRGCLSTLNADPARELFKSIPSWEREAREKLEEPRREVAEYATGETFERLAEKFASLGKVPDLPGSGAARHPRKPGSAACPSKTNSCWTGRSFPAAGRS